MTEPEWPLRSYRWSKMTRSDLGRIAKEWGLKGYSGMTRMELAEALGDFYWNSPASAAERLVDPALGDVLGAGDAYDMFVALAEGICHQVQGAWDPTEESE